MKCDVNVYFFMESNVVVFWGKSIKLFDNGLLVFLRDIVLNFIIIVIILVFIMFLLLWIGIGVSFCI